MLKQDKSFRLPKSVKRVMASMTDQKASEFKNLMIKAIIAGSVEPPREKKKGRRKMAVVEDDE